MKGKMTYLSVCLCLCSRESDEESSNSKHGFGGWLSFLSLFSLTRLPVWFRGGVCWQCSVVAGGDWGRERDGSLPKMRSVKQVGGEAFADVVLWGSLPAWFRGGQRRLG
jgi:hypothetical protein